MQLVGTKQHSVRMFSDGMDEKTLKANPSCERPTECRNDNNVDKISQLLLQNSHISLRMLADEMNTGKDTVRKGIVEDLRKWKICWRFVPHPLTSDRKDQRIAAWRDLNATSDSDTDFFNLSAWSDGHCPHAARSHSFVYISTS